MGRRLAAAIAAAPVRDHNSTRRAPQDNESKVRTYLRLLVGAPVRASDHLDHAEEAFLDVAADWATRSGVDRRTLAELGVPRHVLDAAGIVPTPVGELVRRQYGRSPFTVADLVRKSGVSIVSVRTVLAEDEKAGRVGRLDSGGRAIHYRLL